MMKIIYNIKKLVATKVINSVLFWDGTNGVAGRTVVPTLRVHETRPEAQESTEGCGTSAGWPKAAILADVRNSARSAGTATVSISKSKRIKEYGAACFPAISVEEKSLVEATTNIELTTIIGVVTSRRKSCKRCRSWQSKARNRRVINSLGSYSIIYTCCTCEIFIPIIPVVWFTPVIISYIIERERCLYSLSCRGITINSQPLILVIIIGLKFLRFISSTKSKIFFSSLLFQLHLFDTKSLIISLLNSIFNFTLSSPVFTSNFAFKVCFRLLHTIFKLKKVKMGWRWILSLNDTIHDLSLLCKRNGGTIWWYCIWIELKQIRMCSCSN